MALLGFVTRTEVDVGFDEIKRVKLGKDGLFGTACFREPRVKKSQKEDMKVEVSTCQFVEYVPSAGKRY